VIKEALVLKRFCYILKVAHHKIHFYNGREENEVKESNKLLMIECEGNSQPLKAIKGKQLEALITGT